MAQLTLDQTDIDRIEEVRRQFDPAEHLATAGLFEDLRFEEREAALKFMREMLRDELYGGFIERAALEVMVKHRVVCSSGIAQQKLDEDWDDRLRPHPTGRPRTFRQSNWGHNLGYMSEDIWNFISTVEEQKHVLFKALWILIDLAVIAMFGPIGNNYDEPSLEEV